MLWDGVLNTHEGKISFKMFSLWLSKRNTRYGVFP